MSTNWSYADVIDSNTLDTNNLRPAGTFAPSFRYEYQSDSSHVYWYFSEFSLNKHKLFLANWCAPRIINFDKSNQQLVQDWTPQEMNTRSTTRVFPVSSGDTLGLYRELWFRKFGTSPPVYDYYKCSEVLSYSVELVDSASGSRIAMLDTTRFDTTRSSRKPCIESWYPMFSEVRYVVPDGYSLQPVFLRINTYVVGSNADIMIRVDQHGQMKSSTSLASSGVQQYCQQVQSNLDCNSSGSCDVSVTASSSPPTLSITAAATSTANSVEVYSISGTKIWSGPIPQPSNPFSEYVPGSSLYLVIARSFSNIVCTNKIIVP